LNAVGKIVSCVSPSRHGYESPPNLRSVPSDTGKLQRTRGVP